MISWGTIPEDHGNGLYVIYIGPGITVTGGGEPSSIASAASKSSRSMAFRNAEGAVRGIQRDRAQFAARRSSRAVYRKRYAALAAASSPCS
jgi:hypothetical protein